VEWEVAGMEVLRTTVLAVLSVNAECVDRVWRLYGEHEGLVLVLTNDPHELLRVVVPLIPVQKNIGGILGGVLIDLSTPPPPAAVEAQWRAGNGLAEENSRDRTAEGETAVDIIKLLAAAGVGSTAPLIAVSEDETLRTRLHAAGIALCGFLSPADDDATRRLALDTVLAVQRQPKLTASCRGEHQLQGIIAPATAIFLSDSLWFDPSACEVLRQGRHIPLTARESFLLSILLRSPHTYLPASELARRLTLPNAYPVDVHSIQQAIYMLRRKLGECKEKSHLLRVRRGVGYGIFP
jgi:DNA-binding response OmpR family regulator